jgi:YD repeat-containing protein
MKRQNLIVTAILLLFLASCQREVSDLNNPTTANPTNNPLQPGSGRLVAMYARDSTRPAGQDTVYIHRLEYDASGRVVSITMSSKETANGDSTHHKFAYQGSDTLAYQISSYSRITGPFSYTSYDTLWPKYAGGRLISDSMVTRSSTSPNAFYQTTHYVYNSNTVFHYRHSMFDPPITAADTAINGILSSVTSTNGNITAETDDSAIYNPQTGAFRIGGRAGTFSATYDSRPNPAFVAGRAYRIPFVPVEYFIELYTDGTITGNLPLTSSQTNSVYTGGMIQTTNSYVFRADGLPASRTLKILDSGTWSSDTLYYVYQ